MNWRAALADADADRLPPARTVSPRGLAGLLSGGSRSGLLPAVAAAQEVRGAGARLRKLPCGGGGGPRTERASFAFSSCLPKLQGALAPVPLASQPRPGALASALPRWRRPGGWGRGRGGDGAGQRGVDAGPRRELPEAMSAGPGRTSPLLPPVPPAALGAEDWGPRGTDAAPRSQPLPAAARGPGARWGCEAADSWLGRLRAGRDPGETFHSGLLGLVLSGFVFQADFTLVGVSGSQT